MQHLCTETSRSYLGRSDSRSDAGGQRKFQKGHWMQKTQASRMAAGRRRANTAANIATHIARRCVIVGVMDQKSAAAIVVQPKGGTKGQT